MSASALRIVSAIAILTILPLTACSERHPVECNAACVADLKRETLYSKAFVGATDEQRQTAFNTAQDELAQGDWSQRLSEVQQEYCRTPGKVDFAKVKQLETDMLKKRFYETRDKHIDMMAALAHPDDVSSQKALTQMRVEGMKDTILKVREEQAMQVCYVPGTQDTSAPH
jgi:hypothetical protein